MYTRTFVYVPGINRSVSPAEFLNNAPFDELVEIDLQNDSYSVISHVEGKYFLPVSDGSFRDMYRYFINHLIYPDDREAYIGLMNPEILPGRMKEIMPGDILRGQFRYKLIDGGWRWVEQIVVWGKDFDLKENIVHCYIFDIQNQIDRASSVNVLSYAPDEAGISWEFDSLTGLLREKSFFKAAREWLVGNLEGWCFIVIDVEHFKLYNDWYGRRKGDIMLSEIGNVLKEQESALAGYMGQDDFCLLIPFDMERIEEIYQKLCGIVTSSGVTYGFLPVFGICMVDYGMQILDMMDRASLAAKQVKGIRHGKSRISVFQASMMKQTTEEYQLLMEFQKALSERKLYFVLQPQCRISTRQIVGAEALIRWRTDDGEYIPPSRFVPILEKYGFVTDLDQYLWEQVCSWISSWITRGNKPIPISVNVSQIDIFTIDVPARIESLVNRFGIPKDSLKIEITESAYGENIREVDKVVQSLRKSGFLVLMDDFGSGYSSLNMLNSLNVDVIKLDAQFLKFEGDFTEKGVHILESTINMAKTLGLPIIVEGVETEEQVSFLSGMGCRYIQGFVFYKPMAVEDFEKIISDDEILDHRGILFKANQQLQIREFMDNNIYSDSMLNNILGGVAFYAQDMEDKRHVNILRHNEQFYEEVNVPDFYDRLTHIERFIYPDDLDRFYDMFERAANDRLNGIEDVIGVYRTDGSLGQYRLKLYYLEGGGSVRKFYGSLRDITSYKMLQYDMEMVCRYSSECIVFMKKRGAMKRFNVVVYGLEDILGMKKEEFEVDINHGRFMRRFAEKEDRKKFRDMVWKLKSGEGSSFWLNVKVEEGRRVRLHIRVENDPDKKTGVENILIIRAADEG